MKDDYFLDGKPVHRKSYCAFLDVLGYSERIRESAKTGDADKLLQEFHSIYAKWQNKLKSSADESLLYFKSFSDNVLIACPSFTVDMESEFGFILWDISEYQFDMALNGFFIRGGLSVGELFVDENTVYGEALLNAYALENNVAVNPIIVLCDESMKLVDKHLTFYHGIEAPHKRAVLMGQDGRYFINYLNECLEEQDEGGEELNVVSLMQHKTQVEAALKRYAKLPAVFAKYSWLAAYHNYFCDLVQDYPGYQTELKIDNTLATVTFGRLG